MTKQVKGYVLVSRCKYAGGETHAYYVWTAGVGGVPWRKVTGDGTWYPSYTLKVYDSREGAMRARSRLRRLYPENQLDTNCRVAETGDVLDKENCPDFNAHYLWEAEDDAGS